MDICFKFNYSPPLYQLSYRGDMRICSKCQVYTLTFIVWVWLIQTVYLTLVRMAEWSKALCSGRSPLLWAWVRIPLLTNVFARVLYDAHSQGNKVEIGYNLRKLRKLGTFDENLSNRRTR